MSDFRYYLSDCRNNNEAIEEYQEYFNDTSSYDIDVEDFRTVMEKSPIGRKSDSTRGMELDTLSELATWERSGSNWLEIGPSLGNALLKAGLVKEKPKLDEDEWDEHLSGRTVAELKELATKAAIPVQGKKSEVVRTLAAAAVEGKLKLKAPLFVQPTDSFDAWFDELQKSYVDDLQNSLRQGYPGCFQATVWSNAIDENAEWPVIVREIRQRHGGLLKKFEYVVPETSNEGNADSIWEVSVSYRDDYSDFDVPGNALSVPGTTVVFDYTSSDGQTTKNRHVDAEQVWSLGRAIYLRGHCHLRDASRTFRVDRMQGNLVNTETGELLEASTIDSPRVLADMLSANGNVSTRKKSGCLATTLKWGITLLVVVLVVSWFLG